MAHVIDTVSIPSPQAQFQVPARVIPSAAQCDRGSVCGSPALSLWVADNSGSLRGVSQQMVSGLRFGAWDN